MTKEETRDYLRLAEALIDKLPDGAKIIDVQIGSVVQLYGDFDFREFAEKNGSRIESYLHKNKIHMSARLFGLNLVTVVDSKNSRYIQEVKRCRRALQK